MAEYNIQPGMRRHRTLKYHKADGSPGSIQDPPTWDMVNPELANVLVDEANMHATIDHNGGIGDLTITSRADGDVGIGDHPIILTDIFHMLPPKELDAAGGMSEVSEEEPIPA